jgi:hypothetical protein
VDERSARRRPLQAALVVDRQTVKSVWHAASAGRLVSRSLWQLNLPGRDPPVLATWNIHAAEKAIKHALSCLLLHVDYPERRESASIHRYDWREKSCCRKRRICERMARVARTAVFINSVSFSTTVSIFVLTVRLLFLFSPAFALLSLCISSSRKCHKAFH